MLIYVAIGFFTELISVLSSCFINSNIVSKKIVSLAKKGYKLDYKTYEEYFNKVNSKNRQLVNNILLFLPGINLLSSLVNKYQILNDNDPLINENKIPMTSKELNEFNNLKNYSQQLLFTLFIYLNNIEERELTFDNKTPIIIDNCLIKLEEKILPLSYSLDEVLKLNSLTNCSYRLGKVDNINTAIIGIPNSEYKVLRVQYNFDKDLTTHNFKEMSLKEAKDEKFVVYLFNDTEDIKNVVNKGVEKIKLERRKNNNPIPSPITYNYELKRIRKR